MDLLCTLIYMILVSACGCLLLRRWKMDPVLLLPVGFMVGSVLLGGIMFFLASTGRVSPIPITLLVIGMLATGILGVPTVFRSLKVVKHFLGSYVYVGKYRLILVILLLVGLTLCLVSAYTPPRSGDAMRYHLAQMKETVRYRGFVYRPYYSYNFPQYFHYIFIPVFMVAGGTAVQLGVYFYSVLSMFAVLVLSLKTKQTKQLLLLALLFVSIPVCIRAATTVTSDCAVVFYGLVGLLLIAEFATEPRPRYLIFAYISLGIALGCKYQALFYLPLYMLACLLVIRRQWKSPLKYIFITASLSIIPFFVASPFLIRNLYYTGDPFWPLLQNLFHVKKDYLYEVTQSTFPLTYAGHGYIGPMVLAKSIMTLVTYSQIVPIIWLLWIGYYFTRFPAGWVYKIGALLYFCTWFLLQPRIYPRYSIYITPIIAIMATSFCKWFHNKYSLIGKLSYIMAILSIILGIGFLGLYSWDFLRYNITRDLKQYHQDTIYYDQYQWMNQNLKDDGRVLVIVGGSHTYYLDKELLRGDPEGSGLVDWSAIRDVEELKDVLRKLQVRYVFYQDKNWGVYHGGSNMMRLIHDLKEDKGVAVRLENDKVKVTTLRVLRKFYFTKVFLLELRS